MFVCVGRGLAGGGGGGGGRTVGVCAGGVHFVGFI